MFDLGLILFLLGLAWTGAAFAVGLWLGPRLRRGLNGPARPAPSGAEAGAPDAGTNVDAPRASGGVARAPPRPETEPAAAARALLRPGPERR